MKPGRADITARPAAPAGAQADLAGPLRKHFGYATFLPLQERIITDVLAGRDVLALMPTGGGKSLCYQLPAVMSDGVTVVVSPLIALMKDQVDSLKANGIPAAFLNSTQRPDEIRRIESLLAKNEIRILYVAPERVMLARFVPFLKNLRVTLFAVDEAHCISEWGHDFRPEYRQLRILKGEFPGVPVIALTATAEPRVREDILRDLRLRDAALYCSSFDRPNLRYIVRPKDDPYRQLVEFLNAHRKARGIVYCQSRDGAETLSSRLSSKGFRALPYHAGLPADVRARNQERFIRDETDIIVATIAFGMGINKPDVRFVVHYDLPKNIEGYYQETGRAGRDGLPADCLLLYGYGDVAKQEYFIGQKSGEHERQVAGRKLREIAQYCDTSVCRRRILLKYFGEDYPRERCGNCDNCLDPKSAIDGTIIAQKVLSCVSRVGERYGAMYVTDILRGSHNQRIIRNGHASLPTFGVGKEYPQVQWLAFIRELVQLGCLESRGDTYPVLALNARSREILRGNSPVSLTAAPVRPIAEVTAPADLDYDGELFETLRELRKAIADEENVPPYVIVHDQTLRGIAMHYPRTPADLLRINGIGEAKLRKYGHRLLREVELHCREKGI